MSSVSQEYRREEYLEKFSKLPEEQQTVHLILALKWLTVLLEREAAMNAAMALEPKQLAVMQ